MSREIERAPCNQCSPASPRTPRGAEQCGRSQRLRVRLYPVAAKINGQPPKLDQIYMRAQGCRRYQLFGDANHGSSELEDHRLHADSPREPSQLVRRARLHEPASGLTATWRAEHHPIGTRTHQRPQCTRTRTPKVKWRQSQVLTTFSRLTR